MRGGAIVLTSHAVDMLAERGIERSWVERTVMAPSVVEPDPVHPDRTRAFRAIPERGGRVLRVVYERRGDDVVVVTTFLDRGRRSAP